MAQKKTLKRQLNLLQVVMLGTAGTLGSGVFILTGHAASVAGPAAIWAVLIAGILSFSIALNYCELATTYPETGGAMTYVREAWGKGLLAFLVGSMDCISSTFYTALSAVGFAYSVSVFVPPLAESPIGIGAVAIAAILLFVILNILGVTKVGNLQVVMGGSLLLAFAIYLVAGFTMPNGFSTATLLPTGRWFASDNPITNIGIILKTIALIYAMYVGFEVIADDAEEVKNPTKTIPMAIMISLFLIVIIYTSVVAVAMGTSNKIAGSETAISDTIRLFLGTPGATLIGIAGMVGALTSVNSSMLSATRESFTLSRDGSWPAFISRLNVSRVPYNAILMIGGLSMFVTLIGAVDFLSYITSGGYLFVLLLSNLSMITLRKKYPYIHRPFKVPAFPLTPIIASLVCLIVLRYSEVRALLFMAGVMAIFTVYYFIKLGVESWKAEHKRVMDPGRYRLVVPMQHESGLENVVRLGTRIANSSSDMNLCLLQVVDRGAAEDEAVRDKMLRLRQYTYEKFIKYAIERNVPMYSKTVSGTTVADGIVDEMRGDNNVRLMLFKWPVSEAKQAEFGKNLEMIIRSGLTNVGVLFDQGIDRVEEILVPVGGGLHSKLAISLAEMLAQADHANIDFIRVVDEDLDEDLYEDQMAFLQEVVMTELGNIPGNANLRIVRGKDPASAVVGEAQERDYDLVIVGSFEGQTQPGLPFGEVVDKIVRGSNTSVLVLRQHQSPAASWLRQQFKARNKRS
ncbi:MAG: amino acid permease [Anaerolineaceae bacterium]|jgi:amino acid transporter/nucleotide-binding universal stress UspA family protein|nr:amino acid permease [Anaerolineaceae bacterium]MDI9530773.1 amino acid permease [Chloroflexota bacterium]